MPGLEKKPQHELSASKAALIQLASKWINVGVQLAVTMVLARLLTPEEYGFVAVLTVFTSFFSMLSDFGISSAIVQFRDLTRHECGTLLTFSFFAGVVLAALFFLVSIGVAFVYGDQAYIPVGAVLMFAVLFNALNMVPNGLLLRDCRFVTIGVRLVVCTASVGAVAMVLAFLGFGYYAIALQSVLTAAFIFVWNIASTRVRPALHGMVSVLKRVGKFSIFQFGHSAIGFFARNLDTLLVGKFFGSEVLGHYNKAFSLSCFPNNYLAGTISSVMHPFLSKLQNDLEALYEHFLRMVKYVSIVSAWCLVVFVICADEIVLIMYGDQWEPAVPMLQLLSFSIWAQAMNGSHGPLLLSTGRSDLLMRSTLINTIMTVTMILIGVFLGSAEHVAGMLAIAYNLELLVPTYLCMHPCLHRSIRAYVVNFVPHLAAVVLSLLVGFLVPFPEFNVVLSLVLKGGLVSAVYLAVLLALGQKQTLLGLVKMVKR